MSQFGDVVVEFRWDVISCIKRSSIPH